MIKKPFQKYVKVIDTESVDEQGRPRIVAYAKWDLSMLADRAVGHRGMRSSLGRNARHFRAGSIRTGFVSWASRNIIVGFFHGFAVLVELRAFC